MITALLVILSFLAGAVVGYIYSKVEEVDY